MLLPALILVGVLVQAPGLARPRRADRRLLAYPITTQLLISVFVAAQAPVLFSRDLRYRTITLYLARPLRRPRLRRWSGWPRCSAATFFLVVAPLLLLYVGGVLAELHFGRADRGGRSGALVARRCCSPLCLAGLGGLVASLTIRRGLRRGRGDRGAAGQLHGVVDGDPGHLAAKPGTPRGRRGGRPVLAVLLFNGVQVLPVRPPTARTPTPPTGTGDGLLVPRRHASSLVARRARRVRRAC